MTRIGLFIAAIVALTSVSFLHKTATTALAVGAPMSVAVETMAKPLTTAELQKIEKYLRQVLGKPEIRLVSRAPMQKFILAGNSWASCSPTTIRRCEPSFLK